MYPLLFYVPVCVSLALGFVYVVLGDGRPTPKLAVVVVFAVAAFLQFATRHDLAGMLLQISLATYLAFWRKLATIP